MPLVSVVIPSYNRAALIGRAIESVRAQTFSDWELVVVDDGSTDDTARIIDALADATLRYVHLGGHRGAQAARNVAVAMTQGEFIAFLDSDDQWLPKKLEYCVHTFQSRNDPRLGVVLSGRLLVTRSNERAIPGPDLNGCAFGEVLSRGLGGVGMSGIVVHRRVVDAGVRFDEALPACQDRDYVAQITRDFRIASLRQPLFKQHRDHDMGHLWAGLNAARGLERFLTKYHEHMSPSDVARLHHGIAVKYIVEGQPRAGRKHLIAAIMRDVRRISVLKWLILSLAGRHASKLYGLMPRPRSFA